MFHTETVKKIFGIGDAKISEASRFVESLTTPHDHNAIHVSMCGQDILGYVPKQIAATLAPLMDEGRTFLAEFVCRNEFQGRYDTIGLTVRIVETTPQ